MRRQQTIHKTVGIIITSSVPFLGVKKARPLNLREREREREKKKPKKRFAVKTYKTV